jgi:hypothetical protein
MREAAVPAQVALSQVEALVQSRRRVIRGLILLTMLV